MDKAKFYKVKSFSDPTKEYTIRQLPSGEWRCECWAFLRWGNCDHLRKHRHLRMKNHGRSC